MVHYGFMCSKQSQIDKMKLFHMWRLCIQQQKSEQLGEHNLFFAFS